MYVYVKEQPPEEWGGGGKRGCVTLKFIGTEYIYSMCMLKMRLPLRDGTGRLERRTGFSQ